MVFLQVSRGLRQFSDVVHRLDVAKGATSGCFRQNKNHFLGALPLSRSRSKFVCGSKCAKSAMLCKNSCRRIGVAISAEVTANSGGPSDVARINTGKRQFTPQRSQPFGASTSIQFQRTSNAPNRNFRGNNQFRNRQQTNV